MSSEQLVLVLLPSAAERLVLVRVSRAEVCMSSKNPLRLAMTAFFARQTCGWDATSKTNDQLWTWTPLEVREKFSLIFVAKNSVSEELRNSSKTPKCTLGKKIICLFVCM